MRDYNPKEELLKQISILKKDIQANWYELGRICTQLINLCKPTRDFSAVLKERNLSYRTAHYLMALYHKFDHMGITPPKDIPWRTLTELLPILTYYNADRLFEAARSMNRDRELIPAVKEGELE